MEKRLLFYFEGKVQGVGFRYTARYLAKRRNLKGWVMNLPDGRVKLLAQGKKEDLDNFLSDLKDEFSGYIKDVKIEELSPAPDLKSFEIRYYSYY